MDRARRNAILLASLILGIGAALCVMGQIQKEEERQRVEKQVAAAATDLGSALEGGFAAARARAEGLATSQTVQAAIATDERTVADLVSRESASFATRPDETIELLQIRKGAKPLSLLRRPQRKGTESQDPLPQGESLGISLAGQGALLLTVAMEVEPLYRKEELSGKVIVSVRVDLRPAEARLWAAGIPARLSGLAEPLALVPGFTQQHEVLQRPLNAPSLRREGKVLVLLASPKIPGKVLFAGGAFLVGGGGVLAFLMAQSLYIFALRKRRAKVAAVALSEGPPPQNADPRIAGKYRPIRLLGTGGMSQVFLAQAIGEAQFEKPVAIKFLHKGLETTEVLDAFLDEARLQSRLSHPNIVQIYDLGRDPKDGTYFIAMEYIEGLDVQVLLSVLAELGERLPLRLALTIALFSCEGLHAAHIATDASGTPLGLVHRDIKPSNILLGFSGAVKLADFGIAKAQKKTHLTTPGLVKGTLSYMAPEQRSGDPVDRRADIFAMGAVLYELITGVRVDLDLVKLLPLGLVGWPHLTPPSKIWPDLPEELEQIVMRALAFSPKDRFEDCRQLAAALEAVMVRLSITPSASLLGEWLSNRRPPKPAQT